MHLELAGRKDRDTWNSEFHWAPLPLRLMRVHCTERAVFRKGRERSRKTPISTSGLSHSHLHIEHMLAMSFYPAFQMALLGLCGGEVEEKEYFWENLFAN